MLLWADDKQTRYAKKLQDIEEIVLHEINKDSNTKISKKRLYEVLEILNEHQVID